MSWRRWLARSAALAGVLAPFAGSPYRGAAPGAARAAATPPATIDVAELLRIVAHQEDHVSAVELAAWLRDGRPGLRVFDVRSADDYAAYHIPGAEHVPLDRLASTPVAAGDTVVLYSDAGVHGAQAWMVLHALGHRQVVFLRNGLHEWLDDVVATGPPRATRRGC